jgi:hypothetical protein
MGVALLVGRCLLAGVFLVAGVGKLADLAGSRRAVSEFGVPERLSRAVGVLLPLCELAVAVALIPSGSARFGALGALLLLLAFVIAISLGLASGRRADCHCFGQFHSAPLSWRTLLRNGVLAAVAGLVVLEGWQHPGVSATAWVGDLGGPGAAVLGLGVLLVGLIVFLAWFSLQLLTQNGRIFARLEAIETAIATSEARGVAGRELGLPAALGAGLGGAGLPVGSPAPDFTLRSLQGDLRSLESLLTGGRPLLLIFSDAGCGPCDALLPEVAGWQREFKERLGIALVATGDETRNRQKAKSIGSSMCCFSPSMTSRRPTGRTGRRWRSSLGQTAVSRARRWVVPRRSARLSRKRPALGWRPGSYRRLTGTAMELLCPRRRRIPPALVSPRRSSRSGTSMVTC